MSRGTSLPGAGSPAWVCGDWEYASQTMTLTALAGLQPQAENCTRAGGYSCVLK